MQNESESTSALSPRTHPEGGGHTQPGRELTVGQVRLSSVTDIAFKSIRGRSHLYIDCKYGKLW